MSLPAKTPRPLSPFMLGSTYKVQLTSALSLMHRITGIGLAIGLIILVVWLAALAQGPESYAHFSACAQSMLGQLVLFGVSVAFFFHLCNGIRHLLWDMGVLMDIKEVYKTGRIVVIVALILTLVTWLKAYGVLL